jgi:hypothetical protein
MDTHFYCGPAELNLEDLEMKLAIPVLGTREQVRLPSADG